MVTPSQAKRAKERNEHEALETAMIKLDNALCCGQRSIGAGLLPYGFKDRMIALYQAAGWTVTYVGDYRDSYYKFEG